MPCSFPMFTPSFEIMFKTCSESGKNHTLWCNNVWGNVQLFNKYRRIDINVCISLAVSIHYNDRLMLICGR